MKIVSQRTGLSPHVVRAWEKRYGAVEPDRSGSNRRLYSDAEIERLRMLHELTRAGHSIGQIAALETGQLRDLLLREPGRDDGGLRVVESDGDGELRLRRLIEAALKACREMDQCGLESVLDRAAVELGYSGLVERLAGPLIHAIGEEWQEGALTAAQEHAATATIRSQIEKHVRRYPVSDAAPRLVVTTPAGQLHELGTVLVTAVARKIGWNVIYLGPSLPAAEIAGAVRQSGAAMLALGISYPADDPRLPEELLLLRSLLGEALPVIAGGRAASAYAEALQRAGVTHIGSLPGMRAELLRLRERVVPGSAGALRSDGVSG